MRKKGRTARREEAPDAHKPKRGSWGVFGKLRKMVNKELNRRMVPRSRRRLWEAKLVTERPKLACVLHGAMGVRLKYRR